MQVDSLAGLIGSTISPNHWDKVGGPGTIQTYGDDRLVISCSPEVHAEIDSLLRELRDLAKRSGSNLQRFPERSKSPDPL